MASATSHMNFLTDGLLMGSLLNDAMWSFIAEMSGNGISGDASNKMCGVTISATYATNGCLNWVWVQTHKPMEPIKEKKEPYDPMARFEGKAPAKAKRSVENTLHPKTSGGRFDFIPASGGDRRPRNVAEELTPFDAAKEKEMSRNKESSYMEKQAKKQVAVEEELHKEDLRFTHYQSRWEEREGHKYMHK
jgi:hypothetical protein